MTFRQTGCIFQGLQKFAAQIAKFCAKLPRFLTPRLPKGAAQP
jgi:hypothetical protein